MRRSTSRGVAALAAPALVLVLVGCSDGGGGGTDGLTLETMEPVVFNVSEQAAQSINTLAPEQFAERITERTGGKISFEFYYAGSLLPNDQLLPGTGQGISDLAQASPSFFPEELPGVDWLQFLGGAGNGKWPHDYLAMNAATFITFQTNEDIQGEYRSNNVIPLWNYASPRADMLCREPSATLEQIEGFRARSAGTAWNADFAAIGMQGQTVATPEIFEALQRGVIDCVSAGGMSSSAIPLGWVDAAKYYVPLNLVGSPGPGYVMNLDRWNALPEEVKQIFVEEATAAALVAPANLVQGVARFGQEAESDYGIIFQEVPELDAALAAHQETTIANLASTAPPSVSDPQGLIDQYLAIVDEFQERLVSDGIVPDCECARSDPETLANGYDVVDWEGYRDLVVEVLARYQS